MTHCKYICIYIYIYTQFNNEVKSMYVYICTFIDIHNIYEYIYFTRSHFLHCLNCLFQRFVSCLVWFLHIIYIYMYVYKQLFQLPLEPASFFVFKYLPVDMVCILVFIYIYSFYIYRCLYIHIHIWITHVYIYIHTFNPHVNLERMIVYIYIYI